MPGRVEYFNDPGAPRANSLVVAVTAVVTNDQGELLLQKRTDNELWGLPGGAMDIGESIREAVIREVKEETTLDVEPTGVVGVVAPEEPALAGLVRRVAPALCGGNAVVVLATESDPLPALTLAEVLATSDLPAGVVNVLSGFRKELLPWLAAHMDVNAIDVAGCTPDEVTAIEKAAADNVKRVVKLAAGEMSPYLITAFMEMKTVWHPVGV